MHDGIHVEKAGIPSATICTEPFRRTATAMAAMWGARDYPVIYTEHPLGGLPRDAVRTRAEGLLEEVVSVLTGVDASQLSAAQ